MENMGYKKLLFAKCSLILFTENILDSHGPKLKTKPSLLMQKQKTQGL